MNKRKIVLVLLALALLVVIPVYAQEATEAPAPTESQPVAGVTGGTTVVNQPDASGLPAGILLIGLGAVAVVGGVALLREGYKAPQGK